MAAFLKPLFPLFISYDGLLDPLGASQIIPYVSGIAIGRRGMAVLSFEKPDNLARGQAELAANLRARGIHWKPLRFTRGFGVVGKLSDLAQMYLWGAWLAVRLRVDVVHARGHPCAQVGLTIQRFTGAKLLFDFRGLWVDERVDKGGWDLTRFFHRLQYRYFKRKERLLLSSAQQVVVLTDVVVDEVIRLGAVRSRITVIPCCADFDHFPLRTPGRHAEARALASLPLAGLVLGYLGSVGPMYMLDRFFKLFELAHNHQECFALVITQDHSALYEVMNRSLPASLHHKVHVKSGGRAEVPDLLPAMDVLVSFIQPSYARRAASPTKLAECFATGIPAICNGGVGDVAMLVRQLEGGTIVDPVSDSALSEAAKDFERICAMGGKRLRDASRPLLGLELALSKYQSVYKALENEV